MNLRLNLKGTKAMLAGKPYLDGKQQLAWRAIAEAGTLLRVQDAKGDHLGWALSDGPEPPREVLSDNTETLAPVVPNGVKIIRPLGSRLNWP